MPGAAQPLCLQLHQALGHVPQHRPQQVGFGSPLISF